ncbi:hypothetical protein BH11ARM2_BH11ARM2_07850 [soil metagenome]
MDMVLERETATPATGLRETVKGTVFMPGDEGYDMARMGWNVTVDQRPAVIVEATCVEDV